MHPWIYLMICALSLLLMLMAYEVKPEHRLIVDAYFRGCRIKGYQGKQIAHIQGLHESQLKRQFNAEPGQHISAYRMGASPTDVLQEFVVQLAPTVGLVVVNPAADMLPLIKEARSLVEVNRELVRRLGITNDWNRQARTPLFLDEQEIA